MDDTVKLVNRFLDTIDELKEEVRFLSSDLGTAHAQKKQLKEENQRLRNKIERMEDGG